MRLLLLALATTILMALLTLSARAELIEKPHFYQVSKGSEVHFLLGTIHLAVKWTDFPAQVHEAFESSKNAILESTYDETVRGHLIFSTDTMAPTKTDLPEKYIEKLRQMGISDKLFPKSIDESCLMVLFYPFMGKYPFYQLDADIFFRAKDSGKTLVRLDTDEIYERSKMEGKGASAETCTVGKLLESLSVEQLLEIGGTGLLAYRNGPKNYTVDEDPQVAYRNKAWMPQILKSFQIGKSFVAVGAAHLYGQNGLIALLKDQGYNINLVEHGQTP